MLSLAAVQWQQGFECGERNEMGEQSTVRKEIKAEALTPVIMKKKYPARLLFSLSLLPFDGIEK